MKKILVLFAFVFVFSFSISAQNPPPKQISGGIVNGKALSLPKPEYPAAAKAVKASGAVNIQVVIDEAGNVVSAKAVSGHPLLQSASEQAALQAKFSPTTLSGQPVRVSGIIVYNFVLPKTENGYEETLKIMGIAMAIKMSEIIPNEEWEPITANELAEDADLAKELMPLASITKETPKEARLEILRNVSAAVEGKLTGDKLWEFDFGRAFAEFMIEFRKNGENSGQVPDQAAVKLKLLKIKEMASNAPKDFPPDVLSKFKLLTDLSEADDLDSPENIEKIFGYITDILQTIMPD